MVVVGRGWWCVGVGEWAGLGGSVCVGEWRLYLEGNALGNSPVFVDWSEGPHPGDSEHQRLEHCPQPALCGRPAGLRVLAQMGQQSLEQSLHAPRREAAMQFYLVKSTVLHSALCSCPVGFQVLLQMGQQALEQTSHTGGYPHRHA